MGKIDYDRFPLGIRYWAEHYQYFIPRYRVYECIGNDIGTFIFKSVDGDPKSFITKTWAQLGGSDFKPFLIPVERIRKRYGEEY